MNLRNIARGILLSALASSAPLAAASPDHSTPAPVAKALGDVLEETRELVIAGFRWGSPVAMLAASKDVKRSAGFSAKCATDLVSAANPDCTAFVPRTRSGFARAYYATARDGLLMVESNATQFDCSRFDDMSLPAAGHRAELGKVGWNYVHRDRRPEGDDAIVETQLFVRSGLGIELTFIKVASVNACGVKSFVSKML